MRIRKLQEKDIEKIISLKKSLGLNPERVPIYWLFLKFFRNTCFVAIEKNKIIGVILGFVNQVNKRIGYFHTLGVSRKYQGKRIALLLLNKFYKEIKKVGGNKVYLTTFPNNKKAIQFYKKNGFSKMKEILKGREKRIELYKNI